MNIGDKINQIRKLRKMTLMELANASGVAQATLSRIENNRMQGTVESHSHIAEALGLTLPELYSQVDITQKETVFQKSGDTTNTFLHGEGGKAVILTKNVLRKKIMPVLLELQAKGVAPLEENPADTEKFIYCLEGEVEITVEGQVYLLEHGDSLYFNASLKHEIANRTISTSICLVISTPPAL
jgi:transcriptional regulator with XRE-family HTH domain